MIRLTSAGAYPSTERTLGAVSLLINGGGLSQLQDITEAVSTGFSGRDQELKSLIGQLDKFAGYLNDQKGDIIAATDSLSNLTGQFADQKPVIDKALKTLPGRVDRTQGRAAQSRRSAGTSSSKFGALTADSVNQTKANLVKELNDLGPVLQSLADAGPALTRSLGFFGTFPFPKANARTNGSAAITRI